MTRRVGGLLGAVLLVLGSAAARGQAAKDSAWRGPLLVSPGGRGAEGQVRTGCPTFSWAAIPEATGYEVVVYEVVGGVPVRQPAEHPMLRAQIPAGATSFTPEAAECLPPGRFGWAVGAVMPGGTEPRWSRPVLFRVETGGQPAPPTSPPAARALAPALVPPPAPPAAASAAAGPRVVTAEIYAPPVCAAGDEMFPDVPASDPFCRWIEQLARDGISSGCGGGNYCPDDPVSRRQLARFLERTMRGTTTWAPAQGSNVLAPPADNATWTVDFSAYDTGRYSSITIGADGLPILSYYESTTWTLRAAHCNDVPCTGQDETISAVDTTGVDVGWYTSIAIGRDGLPIISYFDSSNTALKVAHCNDVRCTGQDETRSTLDEAGNVGWDTSIAIGADGLPIVSYYAAIVDALKVAHCNDVACAGQDETITTVDDTANDEGRYTSIAVGADGLPIISYFDDTANSLKVAHCNDVACAGQNETITVVDNPGDAVGSFTSLAIGVDGLPIISYRDITAQALRVVHCNDVACAGQDETITNVDDPANNVAVYTSITIGADGLPVIAYRDVTAGALKVAHCNDLACSGQNETIAVVDGPAHDVGEYVSITIGVDGLPVMSYYDATAGHLKVAHCANVFCTPYFRRR